MAKYDLKQFSVSNQEVLKKASNRPAISGTTSKRQLLTAQMKLNLTESEKVNLESRALELGMKSATYVRSILKKEGVI